MPELDKAKNALIALEWSEYESRTYSALVQLGKATASKIAKNSNVPPNRVYQVLSKLSERGVVHTTEARGSATEYEASDPEAVLQREKQIFSDKIDQALEALNELKERKQDTEIPVTYTIYGKRELSTYLQTTIEKARKEVFIAVDTLIELRHREILDLINSLVKDKDYQVSIRVLTTERGVNDEYEIEIANNLDKQIGLKISEDEFATIFTVIDNEIMIYTAYGFKDEERGEQDYYGIYTHDKKTTRIIQRSFNLQYEKSEFFREEDKKREAEQKENDADKQSDGKSTPSDQSVEQQEEAPSSGPTSSGPKLG